MRPPATAREGTPSPSPVAFQRSGGPSFGHSLSRPVSEETLVRLGPRHCGQSPTVGSTAGFGGAWPIRNNTGTSESSCIFHLQVACDLFLRLALLNCIQRRPRRNV